MNRESERMEKPDALRIHEKAFRTHRSFAVSKWRHHVRTVCLDR
jgi:hypothetical protein